QLRDRLARGERDRFRTQKRGDAKKNEKRKGAAHAPSSIFRVRMTRRSNSTWPAGCESDSSPDRGLDGPFTMMLRLSIVLVLTTMAVLAEDESSEKVVISTSPDERWAVRTGFELDGTASGEAE